MGKRYNQLRLEDRDRITEMTAEGRSITDGNGRIGRLLLSILSMKNGYCPIIIPPIKRAEYISALQKTNKGDMGTLTGFLLSVIYEEMKSLERLVQSLVR